ncbi:hypothetical protein [Methanocella arvoryzae]|uniref:Uncharacterized protein n=1 Tax=Methanocella arvoryzae (strain DSM 22066 / NBRC 105507 / MRE50) TaxID=351160 RepID=Q0W6H7_METAR|nr:hypothetical protein [Methanocella arvoryzae]CAJ36016.1 hypothetical protein RCIA25 [Methanocella arvoryzae MRE50]
MVFVKWNLIKLGVAALAAVIIIGVVAALVSGFMTAFKPDTNATTSSTTGYAGGARGGGGVSSAVATPAAGASPMPVAYGSPDGMPYQGMPPEGVSGIRQMPASPGTGFASAPASSAMSGPQSGYASQQQPGMQYPYPAGATPSQQTHPGAEGETGSSISNNRISSNSNNISISSNQPFSATSSPVTFLGGRTGSWFNAGLSADVSAPGVSTPLPGQGQEQGQRQQQSPVFIPPASSGAGTPAVSEEQLSPYEAGWRQVLLRLLEVLPLMFPGYFPGLQWYTVSSAY